MVVPPDIQAIKAEIEEIYEGGTDISIAHMISLQSSGLEAECHLHNLEYLGCVLPSCLLSGQRYQVYYYYNDRIQTRYTDPLPYFLVTHGSVLCFSGNAQIAILLKKEEQVEYFHAHFGQLKKLCCRLVDHAEAGGSGGRCFLQKGCLVAGHACKVDPDAKNQTIVFTRGSVFAFLRTGRLRNIASGALEEVSEDRRVGCLRVFLERVRDDSVKARMVNDMMFAIPEHLALAASEDACVIFDEKCAAEGLWIRERSLCGTFYGWGIHLSEGECVFDGKKTADLLEELCGLWQKGSA